MYEDLQELSKANASGPLYDPASPYYQQDADNVASGFLPSSVFYPGDNTHLGLAANQRLQQGAAPLISAVRAIAGA